MFLYPKVVLSVFIIQLCPNDDVRDELLESACAVFPEMQLDEFFVMS